MSWVASYLVASIANSCMLELPTWKAARHDQILQAEVAVGSKLEGVPGVVAMLVSQEATEAQIVVLAFVATNHVAFVGLCGTVLADSYSH